MHNSLVNLSKMRKIAKIHQMVKDGQTSPFCLTAVPIIQVYIRKLKFIPESEYSQHRELCCDSNTDCSTLSTNNIGVISLN